MEHPDCAEVSGVVRANLMFASYLVTPTPSGNCDVQFTLYVDLKGSIPAWIVARVATDQPLSLAGLRDLIVRNEDAGEAVRSDPLLVKVQTLHEELKILIFFFFFFLQRLDLIESKLQKALLRLLFQFRSVVTRMAARHLLMRPSLMGHIHRWSPCL